MAEEEQAKKSNDIVRVFHRAEDSPAEGEGRVILVFADKLTKDERDRLAKETGEKNGATLSMIGQGNELAELLMEHVPLTTLDALLVQLIQGRPQGPFYGMVFKEQTQSEVADGKADDSQG